MHSLTRTIYISMAMIFSALSALHGADLFVDPAALPQTPAKEVEREAAPSLPQSATDAEQLQEVIQNHLAAIRGFDVSRAYYAYTTREFQKTVPLETYKQFVKKYSVLFRNKHVNQESVSFKGNIATFKGKLISHDGDVYDAEIILIFNEDEWKIHSLTLTEKQSSRPLR